MEFSFDSFATHYGTQTLCISTNSKSKKGKLTFKVKSLFQQLKELGILWHLSEAYRKH